MILSFEMDSVCITVLVKAQKRRQSRLSCAIVRRRITTVCTYVETRGTSIGARQVQQQRGGPVVLYNLFR